MCRALAVALEESDLPLNPLVLRQCEAVAELTGDRLAACGVGNGLVDPLLAEGQAGGECEGLGQCRLGVVRLEDVHRSFEVTLGIGVVFALLLDLGEHEAGLGDLVFVARPLRGSQRLLRILEGLGDVTLLHRQACQGHIDVGARGALIAEAGHIEAALEMLHGFIPAAQYFQRLPEIRLRQRLVLDGADLLIDAHALLEEFGSLREVAPSVLDDADVVVCRNEIPEITFGLRSLDVCHVVAEGSLPLPQLVDGVREIRGGVLDELFRAQRLPDGHGLVEVPFGLLPVTYVEGDDAQHVLDVAVDDVRPITSEQVDGPLRGGRCGLVVVLVPVHLGDAVEELRYLQRLPEPLELVQRVMEVRQRGVLLPALAKDLPHLLHHAGQIGARCSVRAARLDRLEQELIRLHCGAVVARPVVRVGQFLPRFRLASLVRAGEIHQFQPHGRWCA